MKYRDLNNELLLLCWSFVPFYQTMRFLSKRHYDLCNYIDPSYGFVSRARIFWQGRIRRHVLRARPLIPKYISLRVPPHLKMLQVSEFEFRFLFLSIGIPITSVTFMYTTTGVRVFLCRCRQICTCTHKQEPICLCGGSVCTCYTTNSLSERGEYVSEANALDILLQLVV